MPELPEVESARAVIERNGLRRRIADVDDSDTFVCRPHAPGEIRHALLGSELRAVMRQGKSMWCQTGLSSGAVTLGIHLGTGTVGGRTSWWCSAEQLLVPDSTGSSDRYPR